MQPRVTIRDIAQKAGVHFTTVSMALRNHPRIPEATRARIRKLADDMGYRPDAMLSALNSYRMSTRKPRFKATLGWVVSGPHSPEKNPVALFREYYAGAKERADRLGYGLADISLTDARLTRARVGSILEARGIRGVLVAPLPRNQVSVDLLPWEKLSSVTFGYSLRSPQLHTVTASQYHAMRTILKELRALGYRRIGYATEPDFERRCDGNWRAAFLIETAEVPASRRVPVFMGEGAEGDLAACEEWHRRHRPDVIVHAGMAGPVVAAMVKKAGLRVPEDIGLVAHDVPPDEDRFAGIDEKGRVTGAAAVDFLVAMINRQEVGIPVDPQQLLIHGRWVPGKTVRRLD